MLQVKEYIIGFSEQEVVIYGGTIWGKAVCRELLDHGIIIKAILDRYQYGDVIEGLVVEKPEHIRNYPNIPMIICGTRGFRSMCDFAEENGHDWVYHAGSIIQGFDWKSIHTWDAYSKEEMLSKYMKYVKNYIGEDIDSIELGEFNVIVTDLCNLKCDMCLARCADVKNGALYEMNELIDSFKKFLSSISCLYKIIICGGEPLIHPELHKLIRFACNEPKIKRIELLTNATIIPRGENLRSLRNKKVRLVMDDYDLPQQKFSEIKRICEQEGVLYYIKKLEYWHDLSLLDDQKYTVEELHRLYRECTESQNYTLVDNKIVNCYRTYVDRQCGDWPKENNDYYIDLNDYSIGDEKLKKRMFDLMSIEYIERCKFCVGTRGENAKKIPVGIQREGVSC